MEWDPSLIPDVGAPLVDIPDEYYVTSKMKMYARTNVGAFSPFYSTSVMVQDKPPMSPDAEFVPYRNINNRMLIILSGQTGVKEEVPVLILDADNQKFNNVYISQGKSANDFTQTMEFSSDDPVYTYQLFRTTVPPTTYSDFSENLLSEYTEFAGDETPATLATYVDHILPNTKYYYCFRSVDIHGNISNPTAIYQVEMIDNNGQIYPDIRLYGGCADINQKDLAKPGRRFIYIAPSTSQTNLEGDTDINLPLGNSLPLNPLVAPSNNILGTPGEDPVWDKIFKIRLTSKKTGRKTDLNLIFKNTGVIDP